MIHKLSVGIFLICLWLLLSWHFTPLLLGLGLVSTLLVLYLSIRMEIIDREGHPLHLTLSTLRYLPWLIVKIVQANLDVTWRILHPRMPIDPTQEKVKCSQKSDLGKVIYANSITLTPGTLSMSIDADTIEVHSLTSTAIEELRQNTMDRKVTQMVGED